MSAQKVWQQQHVPMVAPAVVVIAVMIMEQLLDRPRLHPLVALVLGQRQDARHASAVECGAMRSDPSAVIVTG